MSESEAVDFSLVAQQVMAALRELHERGGLEDVFARLPGEYPEVGRRTWDDSDQVGG